MNDNGVITCYVAVNDDIWHYVVGKNNNNVYLRLYRIWRIKKLSVVKQKKTNNNNTKHKQLQRKIYGQDHEIAIIIVVVCEL